MTAAAKRVYEKARAAKTVTLEDKLFINRKLFEYLLMNNIPESNIIRFLGPIENWDEKSLNTARYEIYRISNKLIKPEDAFKK